MISPHKEEVFESEIVQHLLAHGWLEGDPALYDRKLALYPEDVIVWLQYSQPEAWEKFIATHGKDHKDRLFQRLTQVLDKEGAINVLRYGFKDLNVQFDMCQFRPAQGLNDQTMERYGQVRLRVVRQVRYSMHNENSIDLVFYVNGIPVATAELKTEFTQSINRAIEQYKYDRQPKDPISRQEEPLLAYKKRAIVHFAVSSEEVYMTTELKGKATRFDPFNLGYEEGAGNPPNPLGYRTFYLWERILQRDAFLNILGKFVHVQPETADEKRGIIFPRYHQWEVVINLLDAVKKEKAGHNYLIQHSAGSGKTNTISWLAHQLAFLHDNNNQRIFDTVIIITDRKILDQQLQEAVYQLEHKQGVVERIDEESGSKSKQLIQALKESKPIIIVTIQTFPHVLEAISDVPALKDRSFAVIADEAHSSQTGSAARKLKKVLNTKQHDSELVDEQEIPLDELLAEELESRHPPKNISFFAFTATPKAKTLERFGRNGEPFHVYTMKQAIEEGFILDVLRNFTPYDLAYKLAHQGKEYTQQNVDQSEGMKSLKKWLRNHPHNIEQKATIIIEHFIEHIQPRLGGKAKAMLVTGSRKEAVQYKLVIDRYIQTQGYSNFATLVAFSGEIRDASLGPDTYTELNMNSCLKGKDLAKGFDTDEFQLLIVANKYQTGFDQKKLVAMYVDKMLSGVAAVQTLSRLNRIAPDKEETFIIDFVNRPEYIQAAFEPYYKQAQLLCSSDPNLIHDLQQKLDSSQIYTNLEINLFVAAYFKGSQKEMQAHIAPAKDRFCHKYCSIIKELEGGIFSENNESELLKQKDDLEGFRKELCTFVRLYEFLSQIYIYDDTDLEKRCIFYRCLIPLLRLEKREESIDFSQLNLTHYKLSKNKTQSIDLKESKKLSPISSSGSGKSRDPNLMPLGELIDRLNAYFEGKVTEEDVIAFTTSVAGKMMESKILAKQAQANTQNQFIASPDLDVIFTEATIESLQTHRNMVTQVLSNEDLRKNISLELARHVYQILNDKNHNILRSNT